MSDKDKEFIDELFKDTTFGDFEPYIKSMDSNAAAYELITILATIIASIELRTSETLGIPGSETVAHYIFKDPSDPEEIGKRIVDHILKSAINAFNALDVILDKEENNG